MSSEAGTKLVVTLVATLLIYYSYTAWTSGMAERGEPSRDSRRSRGGFKIRPPNLQGDNTAEGAAAETSGESPPFEPSVADVLVVKAMLTKALSLPPELVDAVVDIAEYWPHTTTERPDNGDDDHLVARGGGSAGEENVFVVSRITCAAQPRSAALLTYLVI